MSATDTALIAEENYAEGFYYQHGIKGHARDLQKAYEYYKRAADAGRIGARYTLGEMFESSLNYPEAFKWYMLALDEGEEFAKTDYIRVAKILGYEEVVRVLRRQQTSLARLLPSDSPLARKKVDNTHSIMDGNSNHDNRAGTTRR